MASAATHAVLPKLATLRGRRLQVDAGLRSHQRRFGEPAGFWLPECAYVNGPRGRARRARHRLHLPRPELAGARHGGTAADPACRGAPSPSRSTGRRSSSSGPTAAIRRTAPTSSTTASRRNGMRLWSISGSPTTRRGGQAGGGARRLLPRSGARPPRAAPRRDAAGEGSASSRSTRSCSATGGRRARSGSARCIGGRGARRRPPAHPAPGPRESTRGRAPGRRSELGRGEEPQRPGIRLRSPIWSGPPAAPSCGCSGFSGRAPSSRGSRQAGGPGAVGAAIERLGLHGSPGPGRGLSVHARDGARSGRLEAIDSSEAVDARVRNLAPDLSLAPLLEP